MNSGFVDGLPVKPDLGKAQFQEELNRWFESKGIIADMRSHLRHLMVTALQNAQMGFKPLDRGSPKYQALNLLVAEYLLRRMCYYTLSVFTSEVPALTNFSCINPSSMQKGKKVHEHKNKRLQYTFQENEIEEIFNALGLPFSSEELQETKVSYLEKENELSLIELLIQKTIELSVKLRIRQNWESQQVEEGHILLSKKWSSEIVAILLREKVKPPFVTAIQEAVFRVTDNELKRIIKEEHKSQFKILAERERKIQEYLRRHEDEILNRLIEAEKDLAKRTDLIDEELTERQQHLCRLAVEWKNKHEEIVEISKNVYKVEEENKQLRSTVEKLEAENKQLRKEGEIQVETIDGLKTEINLLIGKIKEVTESNAILSDQIKVLIDRENKEVSINHDKINQDKSAINVPLLWSKNQASNLEKYINQTEKDCNNQPLTKEMFTQPNAHSIESISSSPVSSIIEEEKIAQCSSLDDDFQDGPPSEEIILTIQRKVQDLEDQSDQIKKNYLEYKLRSNVLESDSESSKTPLTNSPKVNETDCGDFCQNNPSVVVEETKLHSERKKKLGSLLKIEERKRNDTSEIIQNIPKKSPEIKESEVFKKDPTKRQLQNRDFFIKSRKLVEEFEKQNLDKLRMSTSSNSYSSFQNLSSPHEESDASTVHSDKGGSKKSNEDLIVMTPLRTASFYCNEISKVDLPVKRSSENLRKCGVGVSKADLNCLELLEKTRIKSPKGNAKSLRQQLMLPE